MPCTSPVCLLLLLGIAGCFSPTSAQHLSDAAYNLNTAARFGRMDVALEHVGIKAREVFMRTHGEWGRSLRVVDTELSGINTKSSTAADVLLTVTWQRPDEAIIRVTNITQRWTNDRGNWYLTSEEAKGDTGLFGAVVKADTRAGVALKESSALPGEPSPQVGRYHTRVIYGTDE